MGIICIFVILFSAGKNTIQGIVSESGKTIWKVLQPVYMAGPASEEWL
jgi:hypothetical protein